MTLRQIAIRIALLAVVFLVLLGAFRYVYETGSSTWAAIMCIALLPLWVAANLLRIWRWFDL